MDSKETQPSWARVIDTYTEALLCCAVNTLALNKNLPQDGKIRNGDHDGGSVGSTVMPGKVDVLKEGSIFESVCSLPD